MQAGPLGKGRSSCRFLRGPMAFQDGRAGSRNMSTLVYSSEFSVKDDIRAPQSIPKHFRQQKGSDLDCEDHLPSTAFLDIAMPRTWPFSRALSASTTSACFFLLNAYCDTMVLVYTNTCITFPGIYARAKSWVCLRRKRDIQDTRLEQRAAAAI